MKRKNSDWEMPKGKLTRIKDFLPSPDELVTPGETVKVTISLNRSSVEFFKRQAERYHTKYQKMIRELLDRYVSQYQIN